VVPVQPPPPPPPEQPQIALQRPAPAPSEQPQASGQPPGSIPGSPLKDILFDFDDASLRDDQQAVLRENLAWLRENTGATLTIEGHCDERGTSEYNVGLGERRAKTVKDFLVAGGVAEARIRTMSYGEERPFVLGHDESAWKWNRRAHFLLPPS
jgi:peptidoglycan-associated lipoprotein